MAEFRGLDILDFLIIIVKRKKVLLLTGIISVILSYLTIFFFVQEQFDSTAMIIPSEQSSMGGIASLLGSMSDLPIDLAGIESSPSTGMYETLLFSRTFAEIMINKFDLVMDYHTDTRNNTIEAFHGSMETEETDASAYLITVRANSPEKSAEMTNYIVNLLNDKIIDLNIQKSKDNRLFLQKRYDEIKDQLKNAEDSLRIFQSKTGILLMEDQVRATIETYTKLETELALKEIELEVAKRIFGIEHPGIEKSKVSVEEFKSKLGDIKKGNEIALLIKTKDMPEESLQYLRLYRNVKIYNTMLEFIIPLYEQAKFEEQKKIPILQVIDYAVPPEKKSYPPRVLLSLFITALIELLLISILIIKEKIMLSENPKIIYLRKNLFVFKSE